MVSNNNCPSKHVLGPRNTAGTRNYQLLTNSEDTLENAYLLVIITITLAKLA